jgi:hypothetical protein
MKKFKSKYIPDATVFDKSISICYFETFLVRYGKILHNGKYKLELLLPIMKAIVITVYFSKRKPMFHNLYVIGTLWFLFYVLAAILISAIIAVVFTLQIIFGFFYTCLYRKSFISDWDEILGGCISLALSIIGIIAIVNYFI